MKYFKNFVVFAMIALCSNNYIQAQSESATYYPSWRNLHYTYNLQEQNNYPSWRDLRYTYNLPILNSNTMQYPSWRNLHYTYNLQEQNNYPSWRDSRYIYNLPGLNNNTMPYSNWRDSRYTYNLPILNSNTMQYPSWRNLHYTYNLQEQNNYPSWRDPRYCSDVYPYGFVQLQAGIGSLIAKGMKPFSLVVPTVGVGGGYMFVPEFGTRLQLSGYKTKGLLNSIGSKYTFNYISTNIDMMLNVLNILTKFKDEYNDFNVYLIGGVGLNCAWNNNTLIKLKNENLTSIKENTLYAWGKRTSREKLLGYIARIGVLADFDIDNNFCAGIEIDADCLSDRFNSIVNNKNDWMITAQISLTYKFGRKQNNNIR